MHLYGWGLMQALFAVECYGSYNSSFYLTGLKLVEYGEEEDDEAPEQNTDTTNAENIRPSLHPNGKPFWAAP